MTSINWPSYLPILCIFQTYLRSLNCWVGNQQGRSAQVPQMDWEPKSCPKAYSRYSRTVILWLPINQLFALSKLMKDIVVEAEARLAQVVGMNWKLFTPQPFTAVRVLFSSQLAGGCPGQISVTISWKKFKLGTHVPTMVQLCNVVVRPGCNL